jgi:uncharacterized SAM-binding protein YcdF (DUF218 family)
MWRVAGILFVVISLPMAVLIVSLSKAIERQSMIDETRQADVIVVLGAAEYRGRPSPVLRARLDHAYDLYMQGVAPRVMTTGGAGGDPQFTEGEVGRAYLVKRGIPSEDITVEAEGGSTVHSIVAVSEIMRRMGLQSAVLVSDGYHIYRAKRILENEGMVVYGSPRPETPTGSVREQLRYVRQAFGYLLWRIRINI